MRKAFLIGTAVATLLGAPVLTAAAWADSAPTAQAQLQVDAENLLGLDVVNAEGETIGEIDNVVIDADGQVRHVIVGVGGFLGLGEKNVALPWDQIVLSADGESVTVPYTKDQLAGLPSHVYPEEVGSGTVYGYDDDVRVNSYLSVEREAAAEAAEETGETVAEAAAEAAGTTAPSATAQTGATVTTDAARIEASALLGADVRTTAGESVGDVDEIWLDANGQVAGLVVDVGGYLGIGSDPVLLAWSDLQISRDGDDVIAVTALTRDQLESLTSIQNSGN
jgi:sporulation protein YlmC with PRC-barrel domain